MIKFRNSILFRITVSAAFITGMITAIAVVSSLALISVNHKTQILSERWLVGTRLLGQIDFNTALFRVDELYRATASSQQQRWSADAMSEHRREVVNNLMNQYTDLIANKVPGYDLVAFREAWRTYLEAHDNWVVADPHGEQDDLALPGTALDQKYQATDGAIDHLIDIHAVAAERLAAQVRRTTLQMTVLACLAWLFGLLFTGFMLVRGRRNVVKPVIEITRAMSMLAQGQREVAVPGLARRDEIGEMAAACEAFRLNVLALDQAHEATRAAEQQAQMLARHDALTGLANRRVFAANLGEALAQASAGKTSYSVLLIDLDGFKKVNDLQGHHVGDLVLCEIAKRLELTLRRNDSVARLGGDEFAIIAEGEQDLHEHLEGAKKLAGRLLGAIRQPIQLADGRIEICASIGIATCRDDSMDVSSLLRAADIAMYRAKQSGRCAYRFFEQSMDDEMRDQEALERDLVTAIAAQEIRPYYQPLVDIAANRIRGFEALARWEHKTRGFVPPDKFIPLVEQLGQTAELTSTILRQACRDARQWPAEVKVAVNLSPLELKDNALPQRILDILRAENFPPDRLEVEITETALVSDISRAKAIITTLQGFGIAVCLDDFGTGYSSLYHLRELKFDKIKIDRSFVSALPDNAECEKIIDAILGLTHSLSLPTVAEGIETPAVLRRLAAKGCDFGQGYFFGKAVPAMRAQEMLRTGLQVTAAA